jgi:hypothetical protein
MKKLNKQIFYLGKLSIGLLVQIKPCCIASSTIIQVRGVLKKYAALLINILDQRGKIESFTQLYIGSMLGVRAFRREVITRILPPFVP